MASKGTTLEFASQLITWAYLSTCIHRNIVDLVIQLLGLLATLLASKHRLITLVSVCYHPQWKLLSTTLSQSYFYSMSVLLCYSISILGPVPKIFHVRSGISKYDRYMDRCCNTKIIIPHTSDGSLRSPKSLGYQPNYHYQLTIL